MRTLACERSHCQRPQFMVIERRVLYSVLSMCDCRCRCLRESFSQCRKRKCRRRWRPLPQGRDLWLLWPVRHHIWPDHVVGRVPRLLCSRRDALELYLSLQICNWVELVCWCSNTKLILWRIYQLVLMLVDLIRAVAVESLVRIYLRKDCIVNPILVPRVRTLGRGWRMGWDKLDTPDISC